MPLELPGLTVYLRLAADDADAGGQEIPVFKPDATNSGLVSGFVPSEAGQSFEVCVHNALPGGEGVAYTTYIDGREMFRLSVYPFQTSVMKGVHSAAGVRPFTFSKLRSKEDDGEAPSFDISKLGVIEVRVWCAIIKNSPKPVTCQRSPAQAHLEPVCEKAKKVGWHSVSLGNVKPTARLNATHLSWIDSLSKPYAVFRFRYKLRDLLEDEGIAPRAERFKAAEPLTGNKRPRHEEDTNAGPSAKRLADQENVKPEPTESTIGGSQHKATKVKEDVGEIKRENAEIIDLTNRGHSPIRVPVRGEVIDLSHE